MNTPNDHSTRHTRIIGTIGPACEHVATLRRLLAAGMDAVRISFSHTDRPTQRRYLTTIRAAAEQMERTVPVMGDLQGPRLRVGAVPGGGTLELAPGDALVLTPSAQAPTAPGLGDTRIGCAYPHLARDVTQGDQMLIDDGLLRLRVMRLDGDDVHTQVEVGGTLRSHKGINLPGVTLGQPPLTGKDLDDLQLAIDEGFDEIALSFVQSHNDIRRAREVLAARGSSMRVLAKIERPEAVDDLEAIMDHADGLLFARGDLGVELGIERVPPVQKAVLDAARRRGVPTMTATHILGSMVRQPSPTRAEIADVANLVYDGSGGLLLTGETAVGRYPVECVRLLDRAVREAERTFPQWGRHQS